MESKEDIKLFENGVEVNPSEIVMTDEHYKELGLAIDDEDEKNIIRYSAYRIDALMNSKWFRLDELKGAFKKAGVTVDAAQMLSEIIKGGHIQTKELDNGVVKFKVLISKEVKISALRKTIEDINEAISEMKVTIENIESEIKELEV